jgi:8-oxo-dGTP diphosphatase
MPKPIYEGAVGLITYRQRLLMMLRDNKPMVPNPNMWCCIGGFADPGEADAETFLREAEEEISLRPSRLTPLGRLVVGEWENAYFYAPLTDEEAARVRLGNEGQRLEYFSLDQLAELPVTPFTRMFFDQYPDLVAKYVSKDGLSPSLSQAQTFGTIP